ncbi:MAG: hypothetical protein SOZ59_05070 [Candidatus Limivivens sp.]|nr:hypothetical protein [Candidatus Limivivens sp.]
MQVKNVKRKREKGYDPKQEAAAIYRELLVKLQPVKRALADGEEKTGD